MKLKYRSFCWILNTWKNRKAYKLPFIISKSRSSPLFEDEWKSHSYKQNQCKKFKIHEAIAWCKWHFKEIKGLVAFIPRLKLEIYNSIPPYSKCVFLMLTRVSIVKCHDDALKFIIFQSHTRPALVQLLRTQRTIEQPTWCTYFIEYFGWWIQPISISFW